MNINQNVISMGLFGKFGAALRNVVLGREHGADPPSAILVKVAAAYKKAGAAAGAPKILDFDGRGGFEGHLCALKLWVAVTSNLMLRLTT